ncbi:MAG TPA: ATPase, partial [Cyanophyceae cyanobacterium]
MFAQFSLNLLMTTVNSSHRPHSRLLFWLKTIPSVASAIAILVSSLVLVGWILDIPILKSILPNLVTMKANTAIAFWLSGIVLGLLHRQHVSQPKRRIAQLFAVIVVIIGGLTLSQYLFNWNLGIDQLVFREIPGAIGTYHPGRMAPNTALNFILIGSALLLVSRKNHRCHWLVQLLTLTAALIAWQPLLGYAYKFEPLYGIASFTHMALHTALLFIVLCFGILFARPGRGVMRVITSNTTGGFLARRLLVAAIAFPSLLGYVILQGERAQLYNSPFALSLLVIATIAVFAIWIWQNAETLARSDSRRKQAEAAIATLNHDLQRRVSELQTLFEVIPISIAIADDRECQHIRVNSTFAQLLEIPSDANASCTPPNGTSPL